jgi:tetratricopeptide (TPR) repeat protein
MSRLYRLAVLSSLPLLAAGSVLAQTATTDPATPTAKSHEAPAALVKNSASAAVAAFTEALKDGNLTNDRRAGLLNDRAVAYGRLGQTRLAIEDFNRAAQLFPEYAALYNNRGNTLLAAGQMREAIKDFDRAILLTPGYAVAYHNRAGAFMRLGQTADAIRDYTKAIELMPASAAPLSGRGRAFLAEARPYAAMRDFSRALLSDVRFSAAYRARAEAKIEVERFEDAAEDLSRAIAYEPGNAEIFVLRGQAYLASSNAASAIKDFSRAIELSPRSVEAHQGRGLAHAKAEAFEEAEADLARAIELDPRAATAFAYRGFVYKLTAQPELGLKEVDKALRIDPNRAEALWAKGEIEEALGRTDEAIASLRRALAAKPNLKDAIEGLDRLGAPPDNAGDSEIADAGVGRWRVVARAGRYFGVSADYPRVRVPLEMMADGQPHLIAWDVRKAPLQGIGMLKFHAGRAGNVDIEQVALVDTQAATVIGILPHRVGDRESKWTWDETRVSIASIDGVTDDFTLRVEKPKEKEREAGPVAAAPQPRRVSSGDNSQRGVPSWAPWAQKDWGGGSQQRQQRQAPKPKTLFDALFGN